LLLSGGLAPRVAFVATKAAGAPLLILDEPTKGLATDLRVEIVALLKGVLAAVGAVLFISHDIGVPRALGGQVAVMRQARIVKVAPAHTVLRATESR
jgi:peptide/nickel transport system ATP-binding protein